jgi:diaminopimelate epimerase
MRFHKYHALGNDYLVLDPRHFPEWTQPSPAQVRVICHRNYGVGSDGILWGPLPSPAADFGLRIFNPDGSEAGLSGNGAREAFLYLSRNGWSKERQFSIKTLAGEIRATLTSPTTCSVDMARARLSGPDYPGGPDDGAGVVSSGGRAWAFQHVDVGNPQCSIELSSEQELAAVDLGLVGPGIENHELFPNRTNVSWYSVVGPGRIRARIFERGVGETSASGTGATGAAVAYVLKGGDSPVTVLLDGGELTVDVGDDLNIKLTGWAVPVFSGKLSDELVEELRETQ